MRAVHAQQLLDAEGEFDEEEGEYDGQKCELSILSNDLSRM